MLTTEEGAATIHDPSSTSSAMVYVHLCCGVVDIVSPATSVRVQAESVTVFDGERAVSTYERSKVYFCSKVETSPFLLD